jgi:hypothetical protein
MIKENLIGKKFNNWVVIGEAEKNNGMIKWKCRCICGKEKIVYQRHLKSGASKSCGCYRDKITSTRMKMNNPAIIKHNMHKSRLYSIWSNMKHRCYNKNNNHYKTYGGIGVKVCSEWQEFNSFKEWALNNGYNDKLTLDRIDVNGIYEPSNCRWITIQEQQYNKRTNHYITYNGKTQTLTEWADELGINRNTLDARINRGHWSIERALNG